MEVNRYTASRLTAIEGGVTVIASVDAQMVVVFVSDFDRVTAERDQLHVRLTEAEQKADDLLTQLNLSTERVRELTEANGALRVRIANLEQALAGMLHQFDDGVNGGRDEPVPALDFARTLVKPAEYASGAALSASAEPSAPVAWAKIIDGVQVDGDGLRVTCTGVGEFMVQPSEPVERAGWVSVNERKP